MVFVTLALLFGKAFNRIPVVRAISVGQPPISVDIDLVLCLPELDFDVDDGLVIYWVVLGTTLGFVRTN